MKLLKSNLLIATIFIMIFCVLFPLNHVNAISNPGIIPFAYYDPGTFTFRGSSQIVKTYDGTFMAIEANAKSSNGSSDTITINVYIEERNTTKTYTIKTNGETKKFDYIYLGSFSGSKVRITVSSSNSSSTITMSLISYSW